MEENPDLINKKSKRKNVYFPKCFLYIYVTVVISRSYVNEEIEI
jgi:hypothetical protein